MSITARHEGLFEGTANYTYHILGCGAIGSSAAMQLARMGAEHYQQYILPKPTLQQYMKHWYSDEQGDEEPCNAKATSYCSNMSGSFIANSVRKFITDAPLNGNFSFHFPTMMLNKI